MGFLFFEKSETYLREISNKLKIQPSSVKKEIDNLNELNIVLKKEKKIYLNKKNVVVDYLKNIFIRTDYFVYPIVEVLSDKEINFALIFGSIAKGNFKEESDVDLLIIGNVDFSEIVKLLKKTEKQIDRDINPIIWSYEDFMKKRKNKFVKEIFTGPVIMVKGEENEIRRIVGR